MQTILLVEDNELNRDMLGRRLKRRGFAVITAVDGQEGVSRARLDQPDLILMDMSLPVMDGWSATTRLKADPKTASIPVIALTAHAMVGDRDKALEVGCDDYDTKPVDIRRLLSKVETLMPQHCPSSGQEAVFVESPYTSELVKPLLQSVKRRDIPLNINKSKKLENVLAPTFGNVPSTHKILIVDNNEDASDALSRYLVRKGYEVVRTTSYESTRSVLQNSDVALVVISGAVSDVIAFETLRQIRQRHSLLELPVILITEQKRSKEVVRAFEMGVNDCVIIPYEFPVLLVRLKALLKTVRLSHSIPTVGIGAQVEVSQLQLGDSFRPIEILSNKPLSHIYIAQDLRKGRDPSVKLVHKIQLQINDRRVAETANEIFAKEVEALNVVRARGKILLPVDAFEKDGAFYIVSEYIEGSAFTIQTTEISPNDAWKVIRLTDEMLRKIEPLHNCGIIHHRISPSCFIVPKQQNSDLVLIDTGIENRLLLKLQEIYPVETFLSRNVANRLRPTLSNVQGRERVDLYSIGIIALQVLTGQPNPQVFEALRFKESRWAMFNSLNPALIEFLKKMICQEVEGAYTSIPSASRDLLKLWLTFNYSTGTSDAAE